MVERRGEDTITGMALAATSAFAFGTLAIFAKFAYRAGAEPVPLLAARFAFASLLLIAFCTLTRRSLRLPAGRTMHLLLLGGVGYAIESGFYFAALSLAPAAVVGLIFYSYPLWTSVAAVALRLEVLSARLVVALVLGTIGVLAIFSVPGTGVAGPLLALAAALAVTVYYLFAQVLVRGVDPYAAATYTALGAAASLALTSGIIRASLPAAAWNEAFALGLVTAVAFVCLYGAVARIGSAKTSITHMLEPVTIVVLAAIVLGDRITARVVIGAALVISALPVLAARRRPKVPAPDSL